MAAAFDPPLILDAASRPAAARWRDAVLTLLLWGGWAYLLLAAIGTLWVPPFVQHLLPVEPPGNPWSVIRAVLVNLGIAIAVCLAMLLRAQHERRRFAGEDRRLAFALPAPDAVAAALRAPAAEVPEWRAARRLIVHHDAAGNILRAETGG